MYLDNILIYTKDLDRSHIDAVQSVLEQLQKQGLYTNLKKYPFYENEVKFLNFFVLAHEIKMEEERIEGIKTWPKLQSVRNIQILLSFANFYKRFIRNFNKIAILLTSILRTTNDKALST